MVVAACVVALLSVQLDSNSILREFDSVVVVFSVHARACGSSHTLLFFLFACYVLAGLGTHPKQFHGYV